jgi:hypothetical protein
MSQVPELTTRDVLQQVDRRLSLMEEDLRAQDEKQDERMASLDAKWDRRITSVETKSDAQFRWSTGRLRRAQRILGNAPSPGPG